MDVRDLFGELRRNVRGCPEPRFAYALNRAAREFCSETWILRRSFDFVCVVGQQQYEVMAPPNEEPLALKHAQITQVPVTSPPSTWPLEIAYSEFFNPSRSPTIPRSIAYVPYSRVALEAMPDKAYPIKVELITQPQVNSPYIPDELGVRYDRALGYGALSWILAHAGNPWFDARAAAENARLFDREINKAKADAAFDFTPGSRPWVRRPFSLRSTSWGY